MSGLLGYFSWDRTKTADPKIREQAEEKRQPVRALPASWYTSPDMYEFERRAVFANRWLFMTTELRLPNAGDYVRYQFAGYDVIIIRDQDNEITAFHNTSKQSHKTLIENDTTEACGNIDLASFPTSPDAVFPIHVHMDRNGFIWINLDASSPPSIPFDECFNDVDVQARYASLDFSAYNLHHISTLRATYNWKVAADNFNECYHCPTTHADIPAFLDLATFDSALRDSHIQHFCAPTPDQIALGVNVHSTYLFPAASLTVGAHFLMVQKFLPTSAGSCIAHYEIFRGRHSSDEDFHRIADMYARVMQEDKVLCDAAQRNLARGVFGAGLLHPVFEKAPVFFQRHCRAVVRAHWDREEREGRAVHPAMRDGLCFGPVHGAGVEAGGGSLWRRREEENL
ncbi:uncharacterized protein M421DRAFT_70228 [Didymella exigua CBS 183.55]|uniref:Choline monooxygenase, chloroplastic n=1 Tax=Didymella exigua CBS 183.55 TaxID=1150837 RepID=A0A6A5RAN9_9PLEO|nr:uncharacterized protein M421DRAFT_70228 [Didymella exigua CBS 183.55]KAF1925291.1 hypothetical protein M421DRAFT_70228 [Didymella exigua CBS 183.55]